MAKGIYKITEEFEQRLADYTGAKYVITLDNMSNGLFLALYYEHYVNKSIKTDTIMCVSFTGPYKHFKLSKGGAILTDNVKAYRWFKRARYSGRRECSYHEDNLDMLGWNFYMMPELSARGLLLMNQFYDMEGNKKHNEDLTLPYPDLSQFKIYNK